MKNTYAGYLGLQQLLSAQKLQTGSDDELLFIIIHQQHELWFKLAIHELDCAIKSLMKEEAQDADCIIAFKRLSRVSAIQHILISSWDVLATLTPDEFFLFRETVGRDGASGSSRFNTEFWNTSSASNTASSISSCPAAAKQTDRRARQRADRGRKRTVERRLGRRRPFTTR